MTADLEGLRRLLDELRARGLTLETPPPSVREALDRSFRAWHETHRGAGRGPVEVRAELLFDSRRDLVGAGTRSTDAGGETFQLAYESGIADVVLDVEVAPTGTAVVRGQVLLVDGDADPDLSVELLGPGSDAVVAGRDPLGRFVFDNVTPGCHRLVVDTGRSRISADLRLEDGGG